MACLAAFVMPAAAAEPPAIRETKDWIIISGIGFEGKGPLPWTHAIRKDTILSAGIRPDPSSLYPPDGGEKVYHNASAEEIAKLPVVIDVATTELAARSASENKTYIITGLTNATAPAALEKILNAAKVPAEAGAGK